jgi:2-polyprenyl-6-methoxyphenol hydroxylase-like FAD-dependent oxidoreductase
VSREEDAVRSTGCVIVGGGPAGMIPGLLLARRGVRVPMLEMHADFERDFRGDGRIHGLFEAALEERLAVTRLVAGRACVAARSAAPARLLDLGPFPRGEDGLGDGA